MKSFLNLPVRAKLFVMFGILMVLFAIAIGVAYTSIGTLLAAQEVARDKQANASDLAQVDGNHNEARVSTLMLLGETDHAQHAKWVDQIRKANSENAVILERMSNRNSGDSETLRQLREFQTLWTTYVGVRDRVIQLMQAGQAAEAKSLSLGENQIRHEAVHRAVVEMFQRSDTASNAALERSKETATRARASFLIIAAVLLAFSMAGVYVLGRLIANPLQELLVVAQRVASGDLRGTLSASDRTDEVGALAQSFRTMTENLRETQREIQEGVNVLATSASEIFTATAQIAASATETATAVSQTTATAEEVKQTAQVSVQKAGHVADIAQKAAQSAQTGRKAIDESVAGMQNVREQMELIAETTVRLSEQSQAIGDIISSVNDLAEQSNLLAVNASIEAAKAGEHGKGFAVVAQEIRNLANQSKESTTQVRTILNDIQRATTATVMAAEQGSKAVEAGAKQIGQSGDAIRSLAESIVSAAQAATQIAASSQEQLVGIDQVTAAIQNILAAARQNATGTQQAEAGAKNLNSLGQSLKAATQRFTV